MGSYNSDSHNVQRVVRSEGVAVTGAAPDDITVENEGDMQVRVQPYEIPYRILLPKRSEAVNLLVPVCFSATHVAYSTLRMEPQYMIVGQAAGLAASLAIKNKTPVQDVPVKLLSEKLRRQRAVLEIPHLHVGVIPTEEREANVAEQSLFDWLTGSNGEPLLQT